MRTLAYRRRAVAALCFFSFSAATEAAPETENVASIRQAIEEYCVAVSDAATERRMAIQSAALKDLESKMQQRIEQLKQEKTELATLLKKREDMRSMAKKELVDIYANMDPEAASPQMAQLDPRLAASVLRQLKPRQASAILDEMTPDMAARLARMIASSAPGAAEAP